MKKILLIDDNASLRESISEILTFSDYLVLTADNGRTGVETALKEVPDIILCDIMMPVLDGYGVLQILRRHEETRHVPFIFITCKTTQDDVRKGMGMGADDYLLKPFSEFDLTDVIRVRLKKTEELKKRAICGKAKLEDLLQISADTDDHLQGEAVCQITVFQKKQVIYEEGQHAGSIYYVIHGKLKESRMHEDGKELVLNMYSKGDFIGYRQVLEGVNYTESLQVLEESKLAIISKTQFLKIISEDMTVVWQFIGLLSKNIRQKEDKLLRMAYDSLRKKVADGIIEVADKFKNQKNGLTSIEISRSDLAHVIGAAQESLIRTLKEFKDEKLIEVRNDSIIVLNDQKLRTLLY